MKKNIAFVTCALAFAAAFVLPNSTSAQTTNLSLQFKLSDNIAVIQAETVATRDQLQATVNALNALLDQRKGDLEPTYEVFVEEVMKIHAADELTAARITAMQDASEEYFGTWKARISEIKNESLREIALKRMEAILKKYNEVIKSLQDASAKFKPYLSNLDDIQKMLDNDLTPGGVNAVRGNLFRHGIADDANWHMKKVRSSISNAIYELDNLAKSLSSKIS